MKTRHFYFTIFLTAICLPSFGQTPIWTQFINSPSGTTRNDDIYFADQTNGWSARGTNGVFRTTNGGQTWTKVITNANPIAHFRCIGFASATNGWTGNLGPGSYDGNVTDTNMLYGTFDGGKTWNAVAAINESGMKGFCAMHIKDSQHIYGVGRVRGPAYFAKSENGGSTWFVTNLTAAGVMGGLMDVYFHDTNNGWAVGMDTGTYTTNCATPYHGAIARTTNGGSSWFVVTNTTVNCSYFWKMSWPTPNVGYVSLQQNASYNTVVFYKTTNGGTTWTSNGIPLSALGSSSFGLQGIGFVSENEGWMGGSTVLNPPFSYIHTTNGGATWSNEGYSNTRSINRIRFVSATLGYASGQALHVYHVPLAITVQPPSSTNVAGSVVNVSAVAQGTAPLTYQWRFNGTNIASANTNTYSIPDFQAANSGSYDLVVADFSGSITSAVAMLNLSGAVVAPNITTPPQSQAVLQGTNAAFTVSASGTPPLGYQWRFGGTILPGSTNSFVRTNVQPSDAGGYFVIVANSSGSVTSSVATLLVLQTNPLFSANFDDYGSPSTVTNVGTTNGYKIYYRASIGPVDFKAVFGFDYSSVTYPTNIPSAPHSMGGTTKGLFLTVNKDAITNTAAVNLYPTNQFFSGNFALKFDMWINWANINTSTEHTLFGINHSGNVTNRIGQTPSDGLFFAVAGDDGSLPTSTALRDYSVFRGGGSGAPILMTTNNTTFGPAPLLSPLFENYDPGFVALFPSQTFLGYGTTPAGTAGMRWIRCEVRQFNNLITWLFNDTIIAQYTNVFAYTNGNILIGYNDHFSSIGDSNNFVILDNIRVENVLVSPVTIFSAQLAGSDFSFSFLTEPYESYTVERATNLTAAAWLTYTNLVGDGNTNTVLVPWTNNATQQYFRVKRP